MSSIPRVVLAPNRTIPSLGFGVGTAWFKSPQERRPALKAAVHAALDAGFMHLDEAEMYANEECTGDALREWLAAHPTPRETLHVTSKVMDVDSDGGIEAVCRRSLQALGCGHFDLYLVHAPFNRDGSPFRTPLHGVWAQMESLVDKGLAAAIGVSNWRICDLQAVFDGARIKPCCNQIEAHPYLQQSGLFEYCAQRNIALAAYAPLAPLTKMHGGPVDAVVDSAAAAHKASPAQVLLRWSLQMGMLAITTTSKPERLEEYKGIWGFELSAEQMAAISEAGRANPRRLYWTQCAPMFQTDPRLEPA